MDWYRALDINRKIALKEMCFIILGVKFSDLNFMFSFRERIEMIYNKLKSEGFNV